MMADDAELLCRYVARRDETAFAELVRRYLNLVYFAALRQVGGDAHRAEDVTQNVFTRLARKASTLARHQTLAGWLHTTTRFTASEAMRAERRRLAREQEAHTMHELSTNPTAHADWEQLRPVIDEALNDLGDADREAVLLRFFANLPFAEVGVKLNLSENTARMRVERALEKLHVRLAKRGVTSTSSALAAVLANQAAATAPAGLAASVTGAVLNGAAIAGVGSLAAIFYFMNASKVAISLAAAGALAIATAVYQAHQSSSAAADVAQVSAERAALAARLAELEKKATVVEQEQTERQAALERRTRSAKAANLAAAATRAAADEEKRKQEKALQEFLSNDPEYLRLRFESHRANANAGSYARRISSGQTPEQVGQAARDYAQKSEIQEAEKELGTDSGPDRRKSSSYVAWEGEQVAKDLCTFLFYQDDPFNAQQVSGLAKILAAANTAEGSQVTRYAKFDWDRVLREAEPILSPVQFAGLRTMASYGRNEVLLATVAKQSAPSAPK